jgi:hypothetical protein
MVHPFINELAHRVNDGWRRADFREAAFPEVCSDALIALAPYRNVDPLDLLVHAVEQAPAPEEQKATRADSVLSLFHGARFCIWAHLWDGGFAFAHSHRWSGAYQVLKGTSLQALYAFHESESIDPKFRMGRRTTEHVEVLAPGATVPVIRGPSMIHGVSYTDWPSMSLSIRSTEDFGGLTMEYYAAGIAAEASFVDGGTAARLRCLDALAQSKSARLRDAVASLLKNADFRTCFHVLRHLRCSLRDSIEPWQIEELAVSRFGDRASTLLAAAAERERYELFQARSRAMKKADHRFLFSALFAAPNRRALEQLVSSTYPDARAFLTRVLREMSEEEAKNGSSLLGTPVHPDVTAILALLLEDPRTESVLAKLAEEYDAEDLRAQEPLLVRTCDGLRGLPVLHSVFNGV